MQPTDPAEAHLADRALELRVLKSAVAVFLVAFASVFYPLVVVFVVFALAYVAYKFTYYEDRIGVFVSDDRSIRHNRLELGLLAVGAVTASSFVVVETVYSGIRALEETLSIPPVDFTDLGVLLDAPVVLLAWAVVLAPVVAVSYAGVQLRRRLLFGLDAPEAAIRATVWESLARLPVYLLWVAVLTVRPVYEFWEFGVRAVADSFGLAVGASGEFAVVLGESFTAVVGAGLTVPAAVIGAYLGVQRWKYDDATIPEVFGYHGVAPPSRRSHTTNLVVPVAVYLLYTLGVFVTIGSLPIGDVGLAVAVAVSVLVGANVLGKTTILARSVSKRAADSFDAIVTGLVVGLVVLGVFDSLVGSAATFTELALTYPVVAVPLTHFGNRIAGRYAVGDISEFIERIEADPDAFDREAADRLFVYSRAWDDTLRATATDGLASLVGVTSYRRDDALDVFLRAIDGDDPEIVRPGLRGIAAVLQEDRSAGTYDRLVDAGCREQVVFHLEAGDEHTRSLATEAAARLFSVGPDTSAPVADGYPTESHLESMIDAVDADPGNRDLASAVVEYFAAVWYAVGARDDGPEPTDEGAQKLLGGLVRLSENADENARLRAILAVTSDRTVTDDERFSLALDCLDSENDEVRYMATHVVRSSMDRRTDRIDTQELVALLEDPSEPVRRAGAGTIATFVRFATDRAPPLVDRLVLHLEEQREAPGPAEGNLIRALEVVDEERLIDHPSAVSTVAEYVDGTGRAVAEPAARVLSSLVKTSPDLVRTDAVGAAIEAGLTHQRPEVRLYCLEVIVAVVDDSLEEGRRFVRGLGLNLDAGEKLSGLSAVCLAELLEAFPEDGLDVLPELSNGLGNLTPIHRQSVPFVVRGTTVSEVTVDILAGVVPRDPVRGKMLVEPLTDIATSADGATLEGVFEVLAELSAEFPAECRASVGTAAAVIEGGRVGVRRTAAEVLANVAAYHPEAVEPFVDRLVVATDDDSPRVRASALIALTNVCTAAPAAIESDLHRVVGLLDDDSTAVREQAARLIVTVAEREPGIIEPAAETADRLRRLQRDPAVDFDPERLQNASTAIQIGVPTEEADTSEDRAEIWSPETANEMGASGDTEIFEPLGDEFDEFDKFDDEFDEPDEPDEPDGTDVAESEREATGTSASEADGEPPVGGDDDTTATETGTEPTDGNDPDDEPVDDVSDLETVIEPSEDDSDSAEGDDVGDLETVIEPSEDNSGSAEGDNVGDLETVIKPSEDDSDSDEEGTDDETANGS